MAKYKNADEIREAFIHEGWSDSISFRELSDVEARQRGLSFAIDGLQRGEQYFVMQETGNIFNATGKVVYYNVPCIQDKPIMDVDEAMTLLHNSSVGFSYESDPARYTIRQQDLPRLFEYVANQKIKEIEIKYCNSLVTLEKLKNNGSAEDYQFELGRVYALEAVLRMHGYDVNAIGLMTGIR